MTMTRGQSAVAPLEAASWRELALLGLLASLWGSSYLLIKVAVADIPPVTLIAVRVSIAAILLTAVATWYGQQFPRDRPTWGRLLVQAFLTSIAAWTILAWGQQYVDSSLASVLNSTSPIFVFLATALITRHEATSLVRMTGACLGLTGVVLIVGVDALKGLGQQVAGQLAAVSGAMLYAGAAIYGRNFSHLPATITAAGTMIWATVCLVPASLLVDQPWMLKPSPHAIAAALTLGVVCTGFALLIYFRLIRTLGSLGVASQAYLRAGIGVLLGMALLGEQITALVGLGLVFSIVGVALINAPQKR